MGILNGLEDFFFFQIKVIADFEFEENTYKNVTQRNNDSILTLENWEQHKDTFFQQRKETYPDGYTLAEKINFEFKELEKLPINKKAYQVLKDRYSDYLKEALPTQPLTKQKPELNETLSEQIRHNNKNYIAKAIQTKYKGIKGVELRILFEALRGLGLFPKGRTGALFYRCCKNDFGNVGAYQAMEKKVFKKGYTNPKGTYIKHDHELLFDDITKFLQSTINTK